MKTNTRILTLILSSLLALATAQAADVPASATSPNASHDNRPARGRGGFGGPIGGWAIYRGGAIFFEGTEDCALEDSFIDRVGGNAVFVNTRSLSIPPRVTTASKTNRPPSRSAS